MSTYYFRYPTYRLFKLKHITEETYRLNKISIVKKNSLLKLHKCHADAHVSACIKQHAYLTNYKIDHGMD